MRHEAAARSQTAPLTAAAAASARRGQPHAPVGDCTPTNCRGQVEELHSVHGKMWHWPYSHRAGSARASLVKEGTKRRSRVHGRESTAGADQREGKGRGPCESEAASTSAAVDAPAQTPQVPHRSACTSWGVHGFACCRVPCCLLLRHVCMCTMCACAPLLHHKVPRCAHAMHLPGGVPQFMRVRPWSAGATQERMHPPRGAWGLICQPTGWAPMHPPGGAWRV